MCLRWSADNIAFGSGGALLQKLNRDTQKCAFKCSSIVVNGQERDVYKDPVTDHGKMSKRGRLSLLRKDDDSYETVRGEGVPGDILRVVFENGTLVVEDSFDSIRQRAVL